VQRLKMQDSREYDLFWSYDGNSLLFTSSKRNGAEIMQVDFRTKISPRLFSKNNAIYKHWTKSGKITALYHGMPAILNAGGRPLLYSFKIHNQKNIKEWRRMAFRIIWQQLRDKFYDEKMNNRNWSDVRVKYEEKAVTACDMNTFSRIVSLMLGELNASHMGFMLNRTKAIKRSKDQWQEETVHLGIRFDLHDKTGRGIKIRDVIPNGPASSNGNNIKAGERVIKIAGEKVIPDMDLTLVLNRRLEEVTIEIENTKGKTRKVSLTPITYKKASSLLFKAWVKNNRKKVEQLSNGRLGYVYVAKMDWKEFEQFEKEVYSCGVGREGLIIDVRNNGGGFTTDYLLTVLCQPVHAQTIPRGGKPGYPQRRRTYSTWHKPIVVLCNQNSFSNAEIFSHAIKTLGRGKLVGVQTAGGVISTYSQNIMDIGKLRIPSRGWFTLNDGEDMELNGAMPDVTIWTKPGELPNGIDKQLNKAVEILGAEVKHPTKYPKPHYRKHKK